VQKYLEISKQMLDQKDIIVSIQALTLSVEELNRKVNDIKKQSEVLRRNYEP